MARVCDNCHEAVEVISLDPTMTGYLGWGDADSCKLCLDALKARDWSTLAKRQPAPAAPARRGGVRKAAGTTKKAAGSLADRAAAAAAAPARPPAQPIDAGPGGEPDGEEADDPFA